MGNNNQLQHINQIDGFRFFAVAGVMIAHYIPYGIINKLPFAMGVQFFFILSSFLITRILLNSKQNNNDNFKLNLFSLKQFYIRRSLRIFPIYYIVIIFFFIINYDTTRQVFGWLATYTTNMYISYINNPSTGIFMHLWSLAVEEQFYLLFPFLIFGIRKKYILPFLIFVFAVGVVGRILLYWQQPNQITFSAFNSISALDSLGLGAILGYLSICNPSLILIFFRKKIYFLIIFIVFATLLIFPMLLHLKFNIYRFSLYLLSINLMGFWVIGYSSTYGFKGIVKKILENKTIVYLGQISYGLYLYHNIVLRVVAQYFETHHIQLHFLVNTAIYTVVTVIIASISWFLIEKPINNLKSKFNYAK